MSSKKTKKQFIMKKLESLNSKKFESFEEHKLNALAAIVGGMSVSLTGSTGSDYSYGYEGHPDAHFSNISAGDTTSGWAAMVVPAG